MTAYKVLRKHPLAEHSLEGPVFAGGERWDSIEDALNDLAATGWEIAVPVYGPCHGRGGEPPGPVRLAGLILVNHRGDHTQDPQSGLDTTEASQEGSPPGRAGLQPA